MMDVDGSHIAACAPAASCDCCGNSPIRQFSAWQFMPSNFQPPTSDVSPAPPGDPSPAAPRDEHLSPTPAGLKSPSLTAHVAGLRKNLPLALEASEHALRAAPLSQIPSDEVLSSVNFVHSWVS